MQCSRCLDLLYSLSTLTHLKSSLKVGWHCPYVGASVPLPLLSIVCCVVVLAIQNVLGTMVQVFSHALLFCLQKGQTLRKYLKPRVS